jgi:hypothetical protein
MLKYTLQFPSSNTMPLIWSLLVLLFLPFIIITAVLWKKGKTVEALLVWNSLPLYIIALILLLK